MTPVCGILGERSRTHRARFSAREKGKKKREEARLLCFLAQFFDPIP